MNVFYVQSAFKSNWNVVLVPPIVLLVGGSTMWQILMNGHCYVLEIKHSFQIPRSLIMDDRLCFHGKQVGAESASTACPPVIMIIDREVT